jgi:hypothetical protein
MPGAFAMPAQRTGTLWIVALAALLSSCSSDPCLTRRSETPGAARQGIVFRNELSEAFVLTRALFVLDGSVLADFRELPGKPLPREVLLTAATPRPGEHTLQLLLQLRGHGYGVFAYLRGYRFETKSSHAFTLDGRRPLRLEVVAWERGDVLTPIERRPAVCYADF